MEEQNVYVPVYNWTNATKEVNTMRTKNYIHVVGNRLKQNIRE